MKTLKESNYKLKLKSWLYTVTDWIVLHGAALTLFIQ